MAIPLAALAAFFAINAAADVTMTQKVELEGGGFLSAMASEGTITTSISNDRSRVESDMGMNAGQTGAARSINSVTIDRLDRGVSWALAPDRQQWSEISFEEKRAHLEEQMENGAGDGKLPVSAEDCRWSDPKMDVEKTGEKQRFANVKAEQHIIIVQETCTVPSSGQTCVVTWALDNWMAKRMPGDDEARDFYNKLAKELGMDDGLSGLPASSRGMMSLFQEGWEDAIDEMSELKGYPVKTVIQMEMGGKACTTLSGQPIAMDNVWGDAMTAGARSGAYTAGYHTRWAVHHGTSQALGGGVGGAVAGSAAGAATGAVVSSMLNHFGKKKKKPPEQAAAEPAPAQTGEDGAAILFRVTSELTAIDDRRVPAEQFEVPPGWKQVEPDY